MASQYGHCDTVRTLLEHGAAVEAQDIVRNQMMMIVMMMMMMMMTIAIVPTIMMMIVINDETRDDCR